MPSGYRAREALSTGARVWHEFYEPDNCSGLKHAIYLKNTEMDKALSLLADGPQDPRHLAASA